MSSQKDIDILVSEVGPRDGLQSIKQTMPTDMKKMWISALSEAGVREIEVGSFVPPKLGQTTSSFLDTDNNPAMLDFGSPLGIGTKRTPMLRYADNLNAQTKFFLGLEQGQTDNRLPSFTSKLKYSLLDDKGSASIRGLAQEVRSRELDNATEFSWGIGIGTNYKITNDLEVNADYSHVKGDSTFLWLCCTNLSLKAYSTI